MDMNLGDRRTTSEFPQLDLIANEDGASQISNNMLVGKVISEKVVNKNVVQMIVRSVWFTREIVKVDQVEPNLFVFSFKNTPDRNRVWKRRPWSFNGAHIVLKEWTPTAIFRDLDFSLLAFWVQIHGLPLCFMNRANAVKIGGIFPVVIFCETSSRTNFVDKRYMRLHVEVDLRKPVLSGFLHKLEGRTMWI